MSRRRRRSRSTRIKHMKMCLAAAGIILVLGLGVAATFLFESRFSAPVENAGEQLTSYSNTADSAQVFMNGQWYAKRDDLKTVLIMGIDDYGIMAASDSYTNTAQTDFLVLYIQDEATGESHAIHLNRDTMTDIPVLGVTGQSAGTRYGQLALAFNYGRGEGDSCENTVDAVSHLLYGVEIDHYIAVTMDAVPIINDWAGGVEVEVLDDFTGIDDALIAGEKVLLKGDSALNYVRVRKGLEDSSNLHRMERQRQYAARWVETAQPKLADSREVAALVMDMSDYHFSDCTVDELAKLAETLSSKPSVEMYELPGEAVKGEVFMEYYVDEKSVQDLVLELFYAPVPG